MFAALGVYRRLRRGDAAPVLDNAGTMPDFMPSQIEARADYWEQRRRAALPSDRLMTGPTLDWLQALPQAVRPEHLAREFPRIVNALAPLWPDRARTLVLLEQLLLDDRGGTRSGFAPAVQQDLRTLLVHRTSLA